MVVDRYIDIGEIPPKCQPWFQVLQYLIAELVKIYDVTPQVWSSICSCESHFCQLYLDFHPTLTLTGARMRDSLHDLPGSRLSNFI